MSTAEATAQRTHTLWSLRMLLDALTHNPDMPVPSGWGASPADTIAVFPRTRRGVEAWVGLLSSLEVDTRRSPSPVVRGRLSTIGVVVFLREVADEPPYLEDGRTPAPWVLALSSRGVPA